MIAVIWKALGLWGSIAAALLVVVAITGGVQTWRLHTAQRDVAKLQAAAADWRAAQTTNLGTIDVLKRRLEALAAARAHEAQQQAEAVERAQEAATAAQRQLAARTNELRRIYRANPNAARWAAAGVPTDILRELPDAD